MRDLVSGLARSVVAERPGGRAAALQSIHVLQTAVPSLASTQQELPYRPLTEVAFALAERGEQSIAFLDSSAPASTETRWSILAWRPRRVVSWPQGRPGAFAALRDILRPREVVPTDDAGVDDALPFHGGWLGWFAYDLGRHLEQLPVHATADPSIPDFVLGEFEAALIEDRLGERLFAVASAETLAAAAAACEHFSFEARALAAVPAAPSTTAASKTCTIRERLHRDDYARRVSRILRYIEAGDIYQANFAYRVDAEVGVDSARLYHRLRTASPAPYGCLLRLAGAPELLSISPELFLRRNGSRVETCPIKGTRPRGATPIRDAKLREELRDDPKERAELLMIVDLERNDLGRVARIGSVAVPQLRGLVTHPTVHHAAATVTAELEPRVDTAALLAATLPGGSVTGAPKIRAMEILEETEGIRRGPYTGCAGYIGYDGNLALNILIRTLVRQGADVHFHVGSAIVADSDLIAEYAETRAKAAALLRALTTTEP